MKYILIVFFLFLLIYCKSTKSISNKILYLQDIDSKFSGDIAAINNVILKDVTMIEYFSFFKKDTLMFYCDTIINYGFLHIFNYEIWKYREKKDTTKNIQVIYKELYREQKQYEKNNQIVVINSTKNELDKKMYDLEVKYWFEPIDSLYSVDIVTILKEPCHRKGYSFLIKKKGFDIEILDESFWTE
jgi:hypothetical protein